jgi:hypothetical protein
VTNDFYNAKMTRDDWRVCARGARSGCCGKFSIQEQIKFGASVLVESVGSAARRLSFEENFPVAGVGGMFRAALMKKYFSETLQKEIPAAFLPNRDLIRQSALCCSHTGKPELK